MLARLSPPGMVSLALLALGWLCALAGAVLLSLAAARPKTSSALPTPSTPSTPSTNGATNKRMETSETPPFVYSWPHSRMALPDSWKALPAAWKALFSIALALSGLSLLAGALPGWEGWTAALGAPGLGGAGMGLSLLAGVLHGTPDQGRSRALFSLTLAWLAVIAGAWALWRIIAG